ncbi:MAG: inositol monophosphatase, partial [Chloroflexi bacterium]|nr:inositol monophosphatase [Chloroflexota bacterium]
MAALHAGKLIRHAYDRPRVIHEKHLREIVTDTDRAAEAQVLSIIRSRHPDHAILAEESAVAPADDRSW